MTSRETLKARRSRAVHRARTRAVASPSESAFALIDWFKGASESMFDTAPLDVVVDDSDPYNPQFWVDGAHLYYRAAAVSLVQDRYGVTRDEAEELVPGTEARRSPLTSIGR